MVACFLLRSPSCDHVTVTNNESIVFVNFDINHQWTSVSQYPPTGAFPLKNLFGHYAMLNGHLNTVVDIKLGRSSEN